MATWAHEIAHVRQYGDKGYHRFLADYLGESASGVAYEDLSFEKEATQVETVAKAACEEVTASGAGARALAGASHATFKANNGMASSLVKDGNRWLEYQSSRIQFTFAEQSRDTNFVYLYNASRDMTLAVRLGDGMSLWRQGNSASWTQYAFMSPVRG